MSSKNELTKYHQRNLLVTLDSVVSSLLSVTGVNQMLGSTIVRLEVAGVEELSDVKEGLKSMCVAVVCVGVQLPLFVQKWFVLPFLL